MVRSAISVPDPKAAPVAQSRRVGIVDRLQIGFTLASLVVIALVAIAADRALAFALDSEDALVLRGQAQALLQAADREQQHLEILPDHPERAQWQLLDAQGQPFAQSRGMVGLPYLQFPQKSNDLVEYTATTGQVFTLMVAKSPRSGRQVHLALNRQHEASLFKVYRAWLALATLLGAAMAAWLGRAIAQRGLQPLRAIEVAAARVGPSELQTRIDVSDFPTELKDLASSLNDVFARLEAAFGRLTDLGTDLAHELRTPLHALRAELEHQMLHDLPAAAMRERHGEILEELDRLSSMIEQMLFLARSEDPRTAIAQDRLDLTYEIERATGFFQASAEDAGVLLPRLPAQPLWLLADRGLVQRALHNLLGNALRYAPRDSAIRVCAGVDDAGPWLEVQDQGPGLPQAVQDRLGQRFVRDDPSRSRASGGSGLGLAIVSSIAKLHGGALLVRPGEGACLRLQLPPSCLAAPELQAPESTRPNNA